MHHKHRKTALVGTALATAALTFSAMPVAADGHLTGYAELDQAMGEDKPFAGNRVTMQTQWVGGETERRFLLRGGGTLLTLEAVEARRDDRDAQLVAEGVVDDRTEDDVGVGV